MLKTDRKANRINRTWVQKIKKRESKTDGGVCWTDR
jgi:hypothetical protein